MLRSVVVLIRVASRQTISHCGGCNLLLKRLCPFNPYHARVSISSSSLLRGLEEFFPPLTGKPSDVVEDAEKSGELFTVCKPAPSLELCFRTSLEER